MRRTYQAAVRFQRIARTGGLSVEARPSAGAAPRGQLFHWEEAEMADGDDRRRDEVIGQRTLEELAQFAWRRARSLARHDVGDEATVTGAKFAGDDDALPHARVGLERGLDLAGLDAEAADFDLLVDAPEELDVAVGPPAAEVSGTVEPRAANGIADEALRGERLAAQIAARDTGATNV